jgi:hypothetical protein
MTFKSTKLKKINCTFRPEHSDYCVIIQNFTNSFVCTSCSQNSPIRFFAILNEFTVCVCVCVCLCVCLCLRVCDCAFDPPLTTLSRTLSFSLCLIA